MCLAGEFLLLASSHSRYIRALGGIRGQKNVGELFGEPGTALNLSCLMLISLQTTREHAAGFP